jgi:DNA-binding CsgD family transcriptional regulator
MRGKKTPEETKAKVIEIKLLNIGLSSYDIAKQLEGTEWEVSADTIQDIIKEFPQLTAQSEK